MDIRVMRYFLAVAEEKNITRAAERLHIAQPSLSKQLMELERELGKQLLIRGKKQITLTEEGVLLRKRAEEIIELLEKTEQELRSDSQELSGDLYLGGGTPDCVLRAAAALQKTSPAVKFHFYSGDAIDVSEKLDHGALDFAVMLTPIDKIKYDVLELPGHSQWGVLMNATDPCATQGIVTREMLLRLPLILHQRAGLQADIAYWAGTDPEKLNIVATYNVVHSSPVAFVQSGLGYYLTTRDMLSPSLEKDVRFCPLLPALPTTYALVWKKHAMLSAAAQAFMQMLKQP